MTPSEQVRRLTVYRETNVEVFVDEVEVRARHLTGREHYGCIPGWAWRGAIAERLTALRRAALDGQIVERDAIVLRRDDVERARGALGSMMLALQYVDPNVREDAFNQGVRLMADRAAAILTALAEEPAP